MGKRVLSYILAILAYIVCFIVAIGMIMLSIKIGFGKVLFFIMAIIMLILCVKNLADEIYKKLNR